MQIPSQTTPPPQQQTTPQFPTVTMVSAPRLPLVDTRLQVEMEWNVKKSTFHINENVKAMKTTSKKFFPNT